MSKAQINLLGPPEIIVNGQFIPLGKSAKAQALCFYLAVNKKSVSRTKLSDLLWSNLLPKRARNNLRTELTKLKKQPSIHSLLLIERQTIGFDPEVELTVDTELFDALLHHPNRSIVTLKQAVDLYRGEFLQGFSVRNADDFWEWVDPQVRYFEEEIIRALFQLAMLYKERGSYSAGISYLDKLLVIDKWHEEAHAEKIQLLAFTGNKAGAKEYYLEYRQQLKDDGFEPAETIQNLYRKLLAGTLRPPDPVEKTPPFLAPAISRKDFVGRTAIIAKLMSALKEESSTQKRVAIVGMSGLGKTVLASVVASRVRNHFTGGVLWANAGISNLADIIDNWATAFGHDLHKIPTLPQKVTALHRLFAGKKLLIILDNVTNPITIQSILPETATCAILITTQQQRVALAIEAEPCLLDLLSPNECYQLLEKLLGTRRIYRESEVAREICDLLGYLPLAIEITGKKLALNPTRSLTETAENLRATENRLTSLKGRDKRGIQLSFEANWHTMYQEQQQIFALMAVFEGRSFTATALAHLLDMELYLTEDRLYDLQSLSLVVQDVKNKRYYQHALLADFAFEKLDERRQTQQSYAQMIDYFNYFAHTNQHNYAVLRPEWDNLTVAMSKAYEQEAWESLNEFAAYLSPAWFARARYTEARQGLELAYEAAVKLGDMQLAGMHLIQLGNACWEQLDYVEAENHFLNAYQIFADDERSLHLANAIYGLAQIAFDQSDYEKAATQLAKCEKIFLHCEDERGIANVSFLKARLQYFLNDPDKTSQLAGQALSIYRALNDTFGIARSSSLIASAYIQLGELDQALSYAQSALIQCEESELKGERASLLNVIAGIYERKKEFGQAEKLLHESVKIAKQIGNIQGEAHGYYVLAKLCKETNNPSQYAKGLDFAQQAAMLAENATFNFLKLYAWLTMGDLYFRLDEVKTACQYWKKVWDEAKILPHPRAEELALQRLRDHCPDLLDSH